MKELSTAIFEKCASSTDLYVDIGGRFYKGRASQGAEYPYVVYLIVSDSPDKTFSEAYEETLLQFSLFSAASGSTEIEDIFAHLKELYDECTLDITGETLVWMRRENAVLMVENHTTKSGTVQIRHYAVDYAVTTMINAAFPYEFPFALA